MICDQRWRGVQVYRPDNWQLPNLYPSVRLHCRGPRSGASLTTHSRSRLKVSFSTQMLIRIISTKQSSFVKWHTIGPSFTFKELVYHSLPISRRVLVSSIPTATTYCWQASVGTTSRYPHCILALSHPRLTEKGSGTLVLAPKANAISCTQ